MNTIPKRGGTAVLGVVVCLSIILAGCGDSIVPTDPAVFEPEVRWARYGGSSYIVEQQRTCFCPHSGRLVRLTVVNDQIVSGLDVYRNRELSSEDLQPYRTVDQLFAFARRVEQQEPDIMSVEYHSTLGYPVSIFVDYHLDALDEQLGYTTRVIRLLPR